MPSSGANEILWHATAVALAGRAVLLRGPSGCGKSDLALRLIDAGARLVADDQTRLWRHGGRLVAAAPAPIAGLIEVRGIGILRLDALKAAPLFLIADLAAPDRIERLPEPRSETILGIAIRRIEVAPFESSAPAKLRLALAAAAGDGTGPQFTG
ncbi:MAG: HPr kinase/phosphatase C-terminal domain-containing protein [Alphaproteobacteria bacterium]|nr:HPr kinase/phosphatase C-terminal domain-containing protein [Alphaproteobacteria bacterium]